MVSILFVVCACDPITLGLGIGGGYLASREAYKSREKQDRAQERRVDREQQYYENKERTEIATEDMRIVNQSSLALLGGGMTNILNVSVEVRDGVATLYGTVPSPSVADRAMSTVRSIQGVRQVNSRLNVREMLLTPTGKVWQHQPLPNGGMAQPMLSPPQQPMPQPMMAQPSMAMGGQMMPPMGYNNGNVVSQVPSAVPPEAIAPAPIILPPLGQQVEPAMIPPQYSAPFTPTLPQIEDLQPTEAVQIPMPARNLPPMPQPADNSSGMPLMQVQPPAELQNQELNPTNNLNFQEPAGVIKRTLPSM